MGVCRSPEWEDKPKLNAEFNRRKQRFRCPESEAELRDRARWRETVNSVGFFCVVELVACQAARG
jgi:hypothetical protein